MRNLVEVLGQVIALIPPEENGLRERLAAVQSSAKFTAPEMMGMRWTSAASVLAGHFGETEPVGWGQLVRQVWLGN